MTGELDKNAFVDEALLGFFRCPERFCTFRFTKSLGEGEGGYFRFGQDIICYGRCSLGFSANVFGSAQYDALKAMETGSTELSLPFRPTEVVANLRNERYFKHAGSSCLLITLIRKLYYGLRPFLGVSARKHLQRVALRDWKRLPFPVWPNDRTADMLMERLLLVAMKRHGVESIPFIWFWPNGQKSCAVMTHDVETASGLADCESLMDLDDSAGVKSSFQFIPEQRYSVSPQFLERVRQRGFEVNVHDLNHDGHLFNERQQFLNRVRKINEYAKAFGAQGFRSGVLYRNPAWYDAFEFSYDMSIPNVGHLDPQRGGCCTILPYFIGNVLEIPLTTVQDYSLFNILQDYETTLWMKQLKWIAGHYGLISVNVHPDYIQDTQTRRSYRQLLSHLSDLCCKGDTYLALPGEVDRWWRARSQMKIVGKGDSLHIEGPQCERARIAWACGSGDTLSYRLAEPSQCTPLPSA